MSKRKMTDVKRNTHISTRKKKFFGTYLRDLSKLFEKRRHFKVYVPPFVSALDKSIWDFLKSDCGPKNKKVTRIGLSFVNTISKIGTKRKADLQYQLHKDQYRSSKQKICTDTPSWEYHNVINDCIIEIPVTVLHEDEELDSEMLEQEMRDSYERLFIELLKSKYKSTHC